MAPYICMYCGFKNNEAYYVRKATKPKNHPHRWKKIGYCCDSCFDAGKPVIIEDDKEEQYALSRQV